MSLFNTGKKNDKGASKGQKPGAPSKGSSFIKGGNASKPAGAPKKVRSTGANRGS